MLILLFILFNFIQCQYHIKNGHIPSFLYQKFENIKEEVFPHDIRIHLSLSRISGTLLYSIDSHMNQLIVSLHNGMTPTLSIEFSGQIHYLSLSKLCGCDQCKFEILDLRIQMRDSMYVQCGARPLEIIKYDRSRKINKAYPMPSTSTNVDYSSPNEAHLWLVNTPQHEEVYPNNKQLSGCIFNVSYNNREIIFSNISANIGRGCSKTCIGDICNGGQCLETYNAVPICNCTMTFLNGAYCNDVISSMNLRSVSQLFIFDMFKVSWISSMINIAEWSNKNVCITISRNGKVLTFTYRYQNGLSTTVMSNLSEKYQSNSESILLAYFQDVFIDARFYNNGTWHHSLIPTNRDLRREIFDSLTVLSGSGNISVSYKTSPKDNAWRQITILKNTTIKPDEGNATFLQCFNNAMSKKRSFKIENKEYERIAITVVVAFVVTILVVLVSITCLTNMFGSRKVSSALKGFLRFVDFRKSPGTSDPERPDTVDITSKMYPAVVETSSHSFNTGTSNDSTPSSRLISSDRGSVMDIKELYGVDLPSYASPKDTDSQKPYILEYILNKRKQ